MNHDSNGTLTIRNRLCHGIAGHRTDRINRITAILWEWLEYSMQIWYNIHRGENTIAVIRMIEIAAMAASGSRIGNVCKMSIMNQTKKIRAYNFSKLKYPQYFRHLNVKVNRILLESQHGRTIHGNIFYISKELMTNPAYDAFEIYMTVKPETQEEFISVLKHNGLNIQRVHFVYFESKQYYKILASAGILINDTSFVNEFVKKREQKYLNVWHGTPLKAMGKSVYDQPHLIGNVQRNLAMADVLLFPNEYTMKHMVEDYMISNISDAKIYLTGYPRNNAFFDHSQDQRILKQEECQGKKIYVYMPTYRAGKKKERRFNNITLQYHLIEMDKHLNETEVMYVRLHLLERNKVRFNDFDHIRPFPEYVECYQFLNICDCLITDYSSVLYDFAITRKKIILFTYDLDEYKKTRGMYKDISCFPFDQVKDIKSLFSSLRSAKAYDDTEFIKKYCRYDSATTSEEICGSFILNQHMVEKEKELHHNGKRNILIYAGSLPQNGVTSSLMNLLSGIDTEKNNYFINFIGAKTKKNKHILQQLPDHVSYISCMGNMNISFWKKLVYLYYFKKKKLSSLFLHLTKNVFEMERMRQFPGMHFDAVIQFEGYEFKNSMLFSTFPCQKIIYVHSDMLQEMKVRKNHNIKLLKYLYHAYDKVAVVNQTLIQPTATIAGRKDNIFLCENIIPQEEIIKKSKLSFQFDKDTISNLEYKDVCSILESKNKIFVNVGRFSPEKGQKRLIDAFETFYTHHPDSYLMIIGGRQYKNLYDKLNVYIEKLHCQSHVILIMSMKNPFPLIKKCNYFVLSSFYEGLGLSLIEASILHLPIMSTDIAGPRRFLQQNQGLIVENSTRGLIDGMETLWKDERKPANVDFKEHNQKCIRQFDTLLLT